MKQPLDIKYRPKTLSECCYPSRIDDVLKEVIADKVPRLIFHGSGGIGKTTAAKVIANEIGAEVMFLNASLEVNKDIVRNDINSFCQSGNFDGSPKLVIFDEFDMTDKNHVQASLRAFIDSYPKVGFIFTCNYPERVIEPIKSRCNVVDFNNNNHAEQIEVLKKTLVRVATICRNEGIEYSNDTLKAITTKVFPDIRKIIMTIDYNSKDGKLDDDIVYINGSEVIGETLDIIGDHIETVKWLRKNPHVLDNDFYEFYYDNFDKVTNDKQKQMKILDVLDNYQSRDTIINRNIHFTGMLNKIGLCKD